MRSPSALNLATKALGSPVTPTCLIRLRSPARILTFEGATPRRSAIIAQSAAFALPSSGAVRTRASTTRAPSDSVATPSMASRPPLGVSRQAIAIPSDVARQGTSVTPASRRRADADPAPSPSRARREHAYKSASSKCLRARAGPARRVGPRRSAGDGSRTRGARHAG